MTQGFGLVLIGIYKALEGLLLVAAAVGLLKLLDRDLAEVADHWIHALRADPNNRYIHGFLVRVTGISKTQLEALSAGTFLYAGLRLAEGCGLIFRKRWAGQLTVWATALFIPLELVELVRRFTVIRVAALLLNVAIVIYLIFVLKRNNAAREK